MILSKRFKQIGKKRFVKIDCDIDAAKESLNEALKENSNIVLSKNPETGVFKLLLKASQKRGDVFENYCLLADVVAEEDGTTKIEYVFALDRGISIYTKILATLCFIVPVAAGFLAFFHYNIRSLFLFIPLGLVSIFGIISIFAFTEKPEMVNPIVELFEQTLLTTFGEGQ